MHRIDADGYIEISGKRYFQDQDDGPPPIVGTIDHALWNNALQEELAQFLEALGVTLAADGAADEAAGWHQMRDKLVLAGGLNAANLTGSILIGEYTGSGEWQQNSIFIQYRRRLVESPLKFQRATFSSEYINCDVTDDSVTIGSAKIHSLGYLEVTKNGANTTITGEGISFSNGPGTLLLKDAHLRKSSFDLTGISWSAVGSNGIYTTTTDTVLDIPVIDAGLIFSAFIVWDAFNVTYCLPAFVTYDSIAYTVRDISVLASVATTPPTACKLILEWDATGLEV